MTGEQIDEIQEVQYAIEKYYEGQPFGDFCDEDTLINVCDSLFLILDDLAPQWREEYEFGE